MFKFFRKGGTKNHQASGQELSAVPDNGTSCESSECLTTSDLMAQVAAFNPNEELATIDEMTTADHGRMVISAREMDLVCRAVIRVDRNNHDNK